MKTFSGLIFKAILQYLIPFSTLFVFIQALIIFSIKVALSTHHLSKFFSNKSMHSSYLFNLNKILDLNKRTSCISCFFIVSSNDFNTESIACKALS